VLIEQNRFAKDRIGVRFAAPNRNSSHRQHFIEATGRAVGGARRPGADLAPIIVHQNRFTADHSGVVASNIAILVEAMTLP
jgi:hypothetical protein